MIARKDKPMKRLVWLLAAMPWPVLAADGVQMTCTATSVVNEGTGERMALPEEPFSHSLTSAQAAGRNYRRTEHRSDATSDATIEHEVDLKAATFTARSHLTRHDYGESYLIRFAGTCARSDG